LNTPKEEDLLFVIDQIGNNVPEPFEIGKQLPEAEKQETQQESTKQQQPDQVETEIQFKSFAEQSARAASQVDVNAQVVADGSAAAPLEMDDESGKSNADDSANTKLESYANQVATRQCNDNHDDDSDEQGGPFVSLSDLEQDDDDFQVSFVSQRMAPVSSSTTTTASLVVG
jgi:hypothetical protein